MDAWLRQVLQFCFTIIIDSFTISMSKQLILQGAPVVLQRCYCRGELLWLGGQWLQLSSRREKRWSCVQGCLFSSIFCVTKTCYVAMPSGYKLVITRALGMHGTYCTQPSGLTPLCFSAIYAIHPSCPCYNYNLYHGHILATACKQDIYIYNVIV